MSNIFRIDLSPIFKAYGGQEEGVERPFREPEESHRASPRAGFDQNGTAAQPKSRGPIFQGQKLPRHGEAFARILSITAQ